MRTAIGLLVLLLTPILHGATDDQVQVCHRPPDNPAKFFTLTLKKNAVAAHLAHGDLLGACSANCSALCDDHIACTLDTCDPSGGCRHTPITSPRNGDGCCPPGANAGNDSDCAAACGDGVISPGETCDPGIPGSCPTTCDDKNACTRDTLVDGGTCHARCEFTEITEPANFDGCCPPGANANNDSDCKPMCGNGILEPGEQCDPPNSATCDANCQIVTRPAAFRVFEMYLRDPHEFIALGGCIDWTNGDVGSLSVNGQLNAQLQGDANGDGLFDMSPLLIFPNFNQHSPTAAVEFSYGSCTFGNGSTCTAGASVQQMSASNTPAGVCVGVLPATTSGYSPGVSVPVNTCFQTAPQTMTISLQGAMISLYEARIGAVYSGDPATNLVTGLIRGFVTRQDAENTIIPLPLLGDVPLATLLRGGRDNCTSGSDEDTRDGVPGWYFYLNISATKTPLK